jgi:hypothetical protein
VGMILSGILMIVLIGVAGYSVYVFSKFILKFLYEKEGQIKRVISSVFYHTKENTKGKWAEDELNRRDQTREKKADADNTNNREQSWQKKEEQEEESISQTEQSKEENEDSGGVQKKLSQKLKWVLSLALIWLVSVIVALYFLSSLFPDLNFAMLVY